MRSKLKLITSSVSKDVEQAELKLPRECKNDAIILENIVEIP